MSEIALTIIASGPEFNFSSQLSASCISTSKGSRSQLLTFRRQAINLSQLRLCVSCREQSFPVLQSSDGTVRDQLDRIYCAHSCMVLHGFSTLHPHSPEQGTGDGLLLSAGKQNQMYKIKMGTPCTSSLPLAIGLYRRGARLLRFNLCSDSNLLCDPGLSC